MYLLVNNYSESIALLKRSSKKAVKQALNDHWDAAGITVKTVVGKDVGRGDKWFRVEHSDGVKRDYFAEKLPVY